MGLLITPTVFVTGPATWEETSFPLQIPGEGTWGQLGSNAHLELIHVGQGLLDPEVDMAAGSPLLCSGKEAVANWEGHPADVHIIFIPFHRLSSSFMPLLCFLLYVHVSATPPPLFKPDSNSLLFEVCWACFTPSVLLPQNVYTVDTIFIRFLACNCLCVFYISK